MEPETAAATGNAVVPENVQQALQYTPQPNYPPQPQQTPYPPYPPQPQQTPYPSQYSYPQQPPYPYQFQPQQQPQNSNTNQPGQVPMTQNPNVFIVSQPPPVVRSFAGLYCASCLVFWFCGWLFGGIAFILAVLASSSSENGDSKQAEGYRMAAIVMNVIGLLVGLAVWGFVIWLIVATVIGTTDLIVGGGSGGSGSSCPYEVYGLCYDYSSCYIASTTCYSIYNGIYYNSCCYYD